MGNFFHNFDIRLLAVVMIAAMIVFGGLNGASDPDALLLASKGRACAHVLRSEPTGDPNVERVTCIENAGAGFTASYLVDKVAGAAVLDAR